jgi:hypothetical protein
MDMDSSSDVAPMGCRLIQPHNPDIRLVSGFRASRVKQKQAP